jgi:CHAT domain-containing protein
VNRLYALPHSELYPLAWQPIEPLLHEGDHVYYVPTGYLSQINFEALASNGMRLADRYHLHRLSTTAQVIGRSEGVSLNNCRNAAVYGDINYAATEEQMAASAAAYLHRAKTDTLLLATRSAAGRGALAALPPLPGTGEEARQISRMMKEKGLHVDLFMGTQANEESMKAYSGHSPQIVHIGTHGFILNTTRDITDHQSFLESIFASEDQQKSALNYTGLMFAGAENVWCGETVPEGVEDGILTSSELSQLDFSHTDLMVLSACETALGHFDESLGEFGLQRALKQAGVNTLVMSLWEVPDEPTQLLMTSFYKQLLSGVECHQALIQARETVRRVYPQPYCWAAFIIVD